METSLQLFFNKLINESTTESFNTNSELFILPINYQDNIVSIVDSNSNNIIKQLTKYIKKQRGTTKRIINPGPREINKFYRDTNLTELINTKSFRIDYTNDYILKVKPCYILKDDYFMQPCNYKELLNNYIFDDVKNYNNYIIVFSIVRVKNESINSEIKLNEQTNNTINF